MASTIKIKNSSTTGAVPTSSDLVQGELAINVTDLGVYTENASGTVVKLNAPSIDDKNTGATKHLTIDTSGNLGLGVTPSAWNSANKVLQFAYAGTVAGGTTLDLYCNAYVNSGGTSKYIDSYAYASKYTQYNGAHQWHNTTSTQGAGNTVTWSTAMTLDASGNLGIGVTNPSTKLHIGSGGVIRLNRTDNGIYGDINYVASTGFVLNDVNGDGLSYQQNGTTKVRIDSSGNLLVGKTSQTVAGAVGFEIWPSAATFASVASGTASYHLFDVTNQLFRFYVTSGGQINATSTSITGISDVSLKENIRDIDTGLNAVMALRPRRFDWKNGDAQNVAGFVAQEVEEILPDLVTEYAYNKDENGNDVMKKALKMGDILPTMVKAIQEQQAIIESLTARIEALEA